jgi:hypothetical protein
VKDGVVCELVKLHTIDKEQSTKELLDWEREAAEKKLSEHYPKVHSWTRNDLLVGHHHLNGDVEEPGSAQLVEVGLVEGRRGPSDGLMLRRGVAAATRTLPLRLAHGAGCGVERWRCKSYTRNRSGDARKKNMKKR